MKRLLIQMALTLGIAGVAVLGMSGCRGGSGSVSVPMPKTASDCHFMGNIYETSDPMFDKCCQLDANAKPVAKINPDAACTPGYGGAAMTGMGFTHAGESAGVLAGNAMDLGRQQGANTDNQSAATAVNAQGTNPSATGSGGPISTGMPATAQNSLGHSGSGASTGGGSAGGGAGNFSSAMSGGSLSAVAPEFRTPDVSGEGRGSAYQMSGAKAPTGGSASSGFDLASLLGGGAAGAKAGLGAGARDLKYGRELASGASANGSADPDMYFSLLSPEDNLFKIVERRYQAKQQQWAVGDATRAAAQLTIKP